MESGAEVPFIRARNATFRITPHHRSFIMSKFSKKTLTIVAAAALTVAGIGLAVAYWTAGGTGDGTASTGTTDSLVINQTSVVEGMAPGVAAVTLSGDFDNPNEGPIHVTTVTASIDSVTGGTGTCSDADYTLSDATMTVNAEVPVGNSEGNWSGATIAFNNTAANQDGCKGATVNLVYTAA